MFVNTHLLPILLQIIQDIPSLELVIYDGEPSDETLNELKQKGKEGLRFVSLDEVEGMGRREREKGGEVWMGEKAEGDDTYCVMYTSGSSKSMLADRPSQVESKLIRGSSFAAGAPKGVMLTHKNIVAAGKLKPHHVIVLELITFTLSGSRVAPLVRIPDARGYLPRLPPSRPYLGIRSGNQLDVCRDPYWVWKDKDPDGRERKEL
jgi:hypothetical protein